MRNRQETGAGPDLFWTEGFGTARFLRKSPSPNSSPGTRIGARPRDGLSLLEVLLSIAILGSSLVVIGQLISNGYRSAAEARLRTAATIHCDAIMAEVASGSIPVNSGASGSVPGTDEWTYSVSSMPGVQVGLLSVTVTVTQSDGAANPLSLSVVRFMPDPDYEPEDPMQ